MSDNKFKHPFSKMAENYRNFRKRMPSDIATLAENEFKENFRRQGYEKLPNMVIPWRRTKTKGNTFGKKSKGILVASGRLKRSLRKQSDYDTARVVTDVPYAQIHNEGGVIRGTQSVRAHLRKGKMKVKAHKRKVNTKMPMRPFMSQTKGLEARIENYMDKSLYKIWNES